MSGRCGARILKKDGASQTGCMGRETQPAVSRWNGSAETGKPTAPHPTPFMAKEGQRMPCSVVIRRNLPQTKNPRGPRPDPAFWIPIVLEKGFSTAQRAGILCCPSPIASGSRLVLRGSVPGKDEVMNSADWVMQARTRLARRRAEKPATKSGQIRALWPDIEAALAVGQSMKTICTWLAEEAGITLGVTSLTSYVSRIRRRETHRHPSIPVPSVASPISADARPPLASPRTPGSVAPGFDPLANFRTSQAKNPGFHYSPAKAEDEKDLISIPI